jgi:Cdc6-like AAA superfamily ATPase
MSANAPIIKPRDNKSFESKQSKYDHVGKLPMRSVVLGPSGSGKTILLQNMILDIYRGCFERIYIMSPSIDVDYAWEPVKHYIEKVMKVQNTKEEPIYFDEYNPAALENIIDTQHKVAEYMKAKNHIADSPAFTRQSKLLHRLYIRGRHTFISTITATQVFNALSPIIRKNITELYVYRLRNYRDLETVIEELSALYDKKTLMELYNIATEEPHSFLYINLVAKDKKDLFHMNFDRKLVVGESPDPK